MSNPRFGSEKFDEIVDKDHILIVREKVDREAILKEVCKRLCEGGYVKKEFYDDVITREKIESTAIGNEVAIPHGMPENVIKPKVFVVKLEYPVNWGGKMVSTIFLLALNFNNIETTKSFFMAFTRLVGSETRIGKIRKCQTPEEIGDIFKRELHYKQ